MSLTIQLHQRPATLAGNPVVDQIVGVAEQLTEQWFTPNVPDDARRDLLFHDALCLYEDGQMRGFLMFTSRDGRIEVTLMGIDPACRARGYGSMLMDRLFEHARKLGFTQVVAMTVPPDRKPTYAATVAFYESHGFAVTRRYDELWEDGALELVKDLQAE
ncbi:MAG: GNAT family N-acetyltransferase [Anaerolineae bacterium]|nr:GNAT family N-acetyltransferase [Anaerolineae bacterium]